MQDLMIAIDTLYINIKESANRGVKKAKAEENYRIALQEKTLIEREKGVPVTIINDICRGDRRIAKLRFERDVADILYETSKQVIYADKIKIQIMNEQMKFEGSAIA